MINFNVIKIGSHYTETCFGDQDIFLVRTHINLPNSLVQKWGKEYISMRDFCIDEVNEMISNNDESRSFYIHGEIAIDRHGYNYLKAIKSQRNESKYHITTFTGIDHVLHGNALFKVNPDSISQIFSVAFNSTNPKMFEATAILQEGDMIKVGNRIAVFCPITNPFLKVWQILPETGNPVP